MEDASVVLLGGVGGFVIVEVDTGALVGGGGVVEVEAAGAAPCTEAGFEVGVEVFEAKG